MKVGLKLLCTFNLYFLSNESWQESCSWNFDEIDYSKNRSTKNMFVQTLWINVWKNTFIMSEWLSSELIMEFHHISGAKQSNTWTTFQRWEVTSNVLRLEAHTKGQSSRDLRHQSLTNQHFNNMNNNKLESLLYLTRISFFSQCTYYSYPSCAFVCVRERERGMCLRERERVSMSCATMLHNWDLVCARGEERKKWGRHLEWVDTSFFSMVMKMMKGMRERKKLFFVFSEKRPDVMIKSPA